MEVGAWRAWFRFATNSLEPTVSAHHTTNHIFLHQLFKVFVLSLMCAVPLTTAVF